MYLSYIRRNKQELCLFWPYGFNRTTRCSLKLLQLRDSEEASTDHVQLLLIMLSFQAMKSVYFLMNQYNKCKLIILDQSLFWALWKIALMTTWYQSFLISLEVVSHVSIDYPDASTPYFNKIAFLRYNQIKARIRSGWERLPFCLLKGTDGKGHTESLVHWGWTIQWQSLRYFSSLCPRSCWKGGSIFKESTFLTKFSLLAG